MFSMVRTRIDPSSRMPLEVEAPAPLRGPREPRRAGDYVELAARSSFSFLQGGSPPDRLVAHAASLGYEAMGLADRDGLYGAVRAHEEAVRHGLRLVLGCELTIEREVQAPPARRFTTMTVLVASHVGYTNLCRILTESHARHPKSDARGAARGEDDDRPKNVFAGLPLARVCDRAEGLYALVHDLEHEEELAIVREAFGARASLTLHRHLDGEDVLRTRRALEASRASGVPLVATNLVRYAERADKRVYDVLHCIREGTTLDRAGRALSPNAEAHLKSPTAMEKLFRDLPGAIHRTREIAEACRFALTELEYRFPFELDRVEHAPASRGEAAPSPLGPAARVGESPNEALRRLTYEGAKLRYGTVERSADARDEGAGASALPAANVPAAVRAQIEKELALIAKLDVAPYFLSVRTIVEMARARDILCQGRGSAANSAVCYCLGVTAVDPARTNLLFERFLSAERHEPPDIDVDFEHERREEVIQEIYARYGRDRAAMVCEIISYRGKSALREVGKVFGFTLEQVERLSSLVSWFDAVRGIPKERLVQAGFDPKDDRVVRVLEMAQAIQGFPRHLSIHVGGFVLSAEPLDRVAPIEPATMPDRTIIPWDKDDLDTLGFFKVDVLGLGMLTAIRKALSLAAEEDPRLVASSAIEQLTTIPPEDPVVYDALCQADTVGVFQIESRAQMAMLPRLRPRRFYDLVVEVALVRPGPIQGGMIHPYLRRRNGEEPSAPPHAILEPILHRTLGVPLFQEQVMQIAIVGAGYTGGEADQLRRDMAAWRKTGKLERHKERLLTGFRARGIAEEFGERLYAQIQGFGEYGFPESHAASFALLVYASSWLKVHHPAAFAAALVNSQPMGFYSASTILQDAVRHGVTLLPICVQASAWDCTLVAQEGTGRALRVGLRQVKGLGEACARRIEAARRPFASVEAFVAEVEPTKLELEALAEAGALDALVPGRRAALWKVRAPRDQGLLAGVPRSKDDPPKLPLLTRGEQLALDYERTGISVDDHPMKLLRERLPKKLKSSRDLFAARHGSRISVAGLVICRQRPMTASGVVFVTMEDEHGFLNLILYNRIFDRFRHVATTSGLLVAHGKVERADAGAVDPLLREAKHTNSPPSATSPMLGGQVVYVVVERLEPLEAKTPDLPSMSRDFH